MTASPKNPPLAFLRHLLAGPQTAFIFLFLLASSLSHAQSTLQARFDGATASFEGSKNAQARYLLRPVLPYAHLDSPLVALPPTLDSLLNNHAPVNREAVAAWMSAQGIGLDEIGGSLDSALSRNQRGDTARYFVIHDTSTPWYGDSLFPADIDSASWRYNRPPLLALNGKAHVFVGRTGESVTAHDFATPWRSTKLELRVLPDSLSKGLFLHIELVQPRRRDSLGTARNDAVSPVPGFTRAQYRRLALLYIAASVRRVEWLVPAFHAVLDEGIPNGHDDPQGFELEVWVGEIRALMEEMGMGMP